MKSTVLFFIFSLLLTKLAVGQSITLSPNTGGNGNLLSKSTGNTYGNISTTSATGANLNFRTSEPAAAANIGASGTLMGQISTATDNFSISSLNGSFLKFNTPFGEVMRLTTTGDVGINTTAPTAKFHVNGVGIGTNTYSGFYPSKVSSLGNSNSYNSVAQNGGENVVGVLGIGGTVHANNVGYNIGVMGFGSSYQSTTNNNSYAFYGRTELNSPGWAYGSFHQVNNLGSGFVIGSANSATATTGYAYGSDNSATATGSTNSTTGTNNTVYLYGNAVSPNVYAAYGTYNSAYANGTNHNAYGSYNYSSSEAANAYGSYNESVSTGTNNFSNYGVYAKSTNSSSSSSPNTFGVYSEANNNGSPNILTYGVYGNAGGSALTGNRYGVFGSANGGSTANGLTGNAINGTNINSGVSSSGYGGTTSYGINSFGSGATTTNYGANISGSGGVTSYGVYASGAGATYINYGVYGIASTSGGGYPYGVYGSAPLTGYAVYANGHLGISSNLYVTGSISKGSGTFKIDHPLDPDNKFLYHSFVESPDMMNIYNGNSTTDINGDATIIMPTYFEALNKDFRYQLTVIGQFAQAIVLEKIKENSFKIKTDKPTVEVSWQVTGVRQDAFANANRVVPEVDKKPEERGKYLHPEALGKPVNLAISFSPKIEEQNAESIFNSKKNPALDAAPATKTELPKSITKQNSLEHNSNPK